MPTAPTSLQVKKPVFLLENSDKPDNIHDSK